MLRIGKKMVLTLLAFAMLLGIFVTPVSAFGVNNRERILEQLEQSVELFARYKHESRI